MHSGLSLFFSPPPQEHQGWVTTLIPPICLSSWRGHVKNVISLRYVEKFQAVLTASQDCTIKLWLLAGRHVGKASSGVLEAKWGSYFGAGWGAQEDEKKGFLSR